MAHRIVIPARLASTRFPEKILVDLNGKPMLQWTIEAAQQARFDDVVVAVDDESVFALVEQLGVKAVMTRIDHISGTSRLAEVCETLSFADDDIIINLQADEPMMPILNLRQVSAMLDQHADCEIATLAERITQQSELFDPNVVKVVFNHKHHAMYFSRASIPWDRQHFPDQISDEIHAYRHIGLYAYRAKFLLDYGQLPESKIEAIESLEQLRWLDAGHVIRVELAQESTPPGIDTPGDLGSFQ